MAKLAVEIEAEGERSALTELQHLISQAIDKSAVPVNFTSSTVNHSLAVAETESSIDDTRVRLADLIEESSTPRQRKAITVLERYAGVIWLSQLLEMSEEDALSVHYFGNLLLPALKQLLNQHNYSWPTQ